MAITLAGYEFEGPYHQTGSLNDRGGVYAVLSHSGDQRYKVLDVGESSEIRSRIENHERRPCWEGSAVDGIQYAAQYTPGATREQRRQMERRVRDTYDPPCGKV